MNIKGRHLRLVLFIKDNRGATKADAVNHGYELSMVNSLGKKGVIAINDSKLYLPLETQKKVKLFK